ncbi:MAG: dihydrodipicolinate synthase family protein [Janthinobacterium lividum]
MTLFRGLCAFPLTPMDAHGAVDAASFRGLVARLVAAGVPSLGVLGSTGTYAYLTRPERRRAVAAAVAEAGGRATILAGIGALRTDEAVRLGQDARDAGADAVLLAPVSYTPLTDDEALAHFAAVAEQVGLPLCVYDNPSTTHFAFRPELLGRLAQVANVVALKTPAPDPAALPASLADLRGRTPPGFSVGHSVDWKAAEALLAGGDAWYSVAAGLFPAACLALAAAAQSGDAPTARALDARLRPLWDLFAAHTSLRVVHAAATRMGLCRGDLPRPLLPLPGHVQDSVMRTVDELRLA